MNTRNVAMIAVAAALCVTGCGTASLDAGYREDDYGSSTADGQPSSLFELQFGEGGAEVTKNIPADAAQSVERAVKSMRSAPPADRTGD